MTGGRINFFNPKKEIGLYAYSGPTDGTYFEDGKKLFSGTDYRTSERYNQYARCGFNILLIQANDPYQGEEFLTSRLKTNMDMALRAGLKVICYDQRIYKLSEKKEDIVSINGQFKDQKGLDNYIAFCLKDYSKHKAFYGILLRDEPDYKMFPSIGMVYRSLKRVCPKAFVQCNLLPLNLYAADNFSPDKTQSFDKRWQWYLNAFLDETQADYLQYDNYPMCYDKEKEYYIRPDQIQGLKIAAEIAKKRGVNLYNVAQSCSYSNGGELKTRKCETDDIFWQTNLLLGFGIKQIAYFTYWRKQVNNSSGEWFYDNGSTPISNNGEVNPLYYSIKLVNKQMQKIAPLLLNSEFCGSGCYKSSLKLAPHAEADESYKFKHLKTIKVYYGSAFITELKHSSGAYIYMVQNIADPYYGMPLEIEIDYNYAKKCVIYRCGNKQITNTTNYKAILSAGHAEFLYINKNNTV